MLWPASFCILIMITFTPQELTESLKPILDIDPTAFLYPDSGALWAVFIGEWKDVNSMAIRHGMEVCLDVMVVPRTNWADSSHFKSYEDLTGEDIDKLLEVGSTVFRYIVFAD